MTTGRWRPYTRDDVKMRQVRGGHWRAGVPGYTFDVELVGREWLVWVVGERVPILRATRLELAHDGIVDWLCDRVPV